MLTPSSAGHYPGGSRLALIPSLPFELVLQICSILSPSDIVSLCQVSRQFYVLFSPVRYSAVTITTRQQYRQAEGFFRQRPDLACHVRKLSLRDRYEDEFQPGASHPHLIEGLVSCLPGLVHLRLRFGWCRWTQLFCSPPEPSHLSSLVTCSLRFPDWDCAGANIRDVWTLLAHPGLQRLAVEFPPDTRIGTHPGPFPRSLDLDGLRGTTKLRTLRLVRVPDMGNLLPRVLALPRQLDSLSLHTTGPLDMDDTDDAKPPLPPSFSSMAALSPLFRTLRRLDIATVCDVRPFALGRFEAVTDLRIPTAQVALWPETYPADKSAVDLLSALLPPSLESLTVRGWTDVWAESLARWRREPTSHRLLAMARAAAACYDADQRSFRFQRWRQLLLQRNIPGEEEGIAPELNPYAAFSSDSIVLLNKAFGQVGISVGATTDASPFGYPGIYVDSEPGADSDLDEDSSDSDSGRSWETVSERD